MRVSYLKLSFLLALVAGLAETNLLYAGQSYEPCDQEASKSGEVYAVDGTRVNVRSGPGIDYDKLVKASAEENWGSEINSEKNNNAEKRRRRYITVTKGYIVRENCRQGDWSQITVLSPDWLRKSHRGWVKTRYLIN